MIWIFNCNFIVRDTTLEIKNYLTKVVGDLARITVEKLAKAEKIKNQIMQLTKKYYNLVHKEKVENNCFAEGDRVPYAARVFDEFEIQNIVSASLEFWLTSGSYCEKFEKRLAEFLNIKFCHLCNSGSSANLLAFMALTSPLLSERRIKPGDEVITVAAGFPTTVTPIIQYGAIPVFLDVTIPQYNINCDDFEKAISSKTKAVMIAHTLGNPFNISRVKEFCDKNKLWLIEDNCDALGSMYFYEGQYKYTGTIGDIGTSSFYPPHHITMGEGGAVYTENALLSKIIMSLRDWGRDCVCPSGKDNICNNRFNKQFGELPFGYDHKYVYSHFGYNLKATEMQASIGLAQLDKFPNFIKKRKENWSLLFGGFKDLSKWFYLPEKCEDSIPSWFGFLLTVKETSNFTRDDIVRELERKNIQTRMLFSGNLIKHPCFDEMRKEGKGYRVVGELNATNTIMKQTFWVGVYPGLTYEQIEYIIKVIREFILKNG